MYLLTTINFNKNDKIKLLFMDRFIYNIIKNINISHILFGFNYHY